MSLTVPVPDLVAESNDPLLAAHESWERVPLSDIARVLNGFAFKSRLFSKVNGTPLIRIRDVGKDSTECGYNGEYDKCYLVRSGELIVGMDGDFKSARWAGGPALLNQRVCKIEVITEDYDLGFLDMVLPGYLKAINEQTSSQTVRHLSSRDILQIPLPLPPLAEQKRIVAQFEALLARVNAASERLAKVPAILKRFRQSVLAAACSGLLTAEWREEHPDTESANKLLERIRKDVLDQLKKKHEIDVYKAMFEEFPPEHSNDELPESWLSCRVGHIGFICNGSTPSRKRPEFWDGEINWVSSGEVQNNIIHLTKERITEAGYSNSSVRLLPPGTVLIAMIGEGKTRGQTAILDIESTINQNMAAIDLRHGRLLTKYLWYWFQFQYLMTRQEGAGSGPPALNCQRVRELQFILPPFAEQKEIVRRVETLFTLADRIERRAKIAAERVEKTTQSILIRAFRGELVETEAELARREGREYESAAQLLTRIQCERENNAPAKPTYKTWARRSAL